jgi:Protein of unknown function (DUF3887)
MKPVLLSLAVAAALALPAAHAIAGACGGGPINTPDTVASHVVTDIDGGDLGFVESMFDPSLSAAMPPQALQQAWASYRAQLGSLRSQGQPVIQSAGAQYVVVVPVQFDNGQGQVRVVLNGADMTIDAMSFLPAAS